MVPLFLSVLIGDIKPHGGGEMKSEKEKTKAELIQELKNMRRRFTELKASEAE